MSAHQSELAVWETRDLRLAIDAAGVALWSWNVDTDKFTMDAHGDLLSILPTTTWGPSAGGCASRCRG